MTDLISGRAKAYTPTLPNPSAARRSEQVYQIAELTLPTGRRLLKGSRRESCTKKRKSQRRALCWARAIARVRIANVQEEEELDALMQAIL